MHDLGPFVSIVLAATVVVALFQRLGLPSLLGFLLTGVVLGPAGFAVVHEASSIDVVAELGVVLLLFTIGIEVSLKDLARLATRVLGGGSLQMLVTTLAVGAALALAGYGFSRGLIFGLLICTSSTALVLRLLGDRGELGTRYGQLSLAILLMQDFAVVALMLVLPMLGSEDTAWLDVGLSVGKAVLIATAIYFAARFVFPFLLKRLVALRNREVFLLAILGVVLGTAAVAERVGLSLALGAFIAGLVISESEFSHQAFAEVLPFRDLFNGVFFVSVGLLIRPEAVTTHSVALVGWVLMVLLVKAGVVLAVARLFRLGWRDSLMAGVALAQVGEFGLVLAGQARELKLVDASEHGMVVTAAVFSMAATPLLLRVVKAALPKDVGPTADLDEVNQVAGHLEDHVVVVGYGLIGQTIARALKLLEVPYVVVEMNLLTVSTQRAKGEPIVFGDASRGTLLDHLGIAKARTLVVAVADAATTREIVTHAHHANPKLVILARTRYLTEMGPLKALGASQVVPEELETALELIGRVMRAYGAPEAMVYEQKGKLRGTHYSALTEGGADDLAPVYEMLGALQIERVTVAADGPAVGRSLAELNLRRRTGATALAVYRDGEAVLTPAGDFVLAAGDDLVLAGGTDAVLQAGQLLRPSTLPLLSGTRIPAIRL